MARETFAGHPIRHVSWTVAGESFELIVHADIDALLDDPRTQRRFDKDEYMPYWAQPWPAATLLAEYVLAEHRGTGRAIDLGCGVGPVALAAARAGWSVLASDYDADAVVFAAENARRNGIELASTATIDWRQPFVGTPFDLVLGSDVLYERRNVEPVAQWISQALAANGTALVADPNRSAAEGFTEAAMMNGLQVERMPREHTPPHGLIIRGAIYRLRWKKR
jgi:predicted nicotinamide N-methyase